LSFEPECQGAIGEAHGSKFIVDPQSQRKKRAVHQAHGMKIAHGLREADQLRQYDDEAVLKKIGALNRGA
jgi:hypothetical protein